MSVDDEVDEETGETIFVLLKGAEGARPEQNWYEFLETFQLGQKPSAQDFFTRWDLTMRVRDPRFPDREPKERPMGIGEKRAFEAWISGWMEPAEQDAFEALPIVSRDPMISMGIVPEIRRQRAAIKAIAGFLKSIGWKPEEEGDSE